MYFAVWATDRDDGLKARLAARDAHRNRLRNPGKHLVTVVAGGPTLAAPNGSMNGSLLIVEADTIEDVRVFVENDPYMVTGVYANFEIRPWQWSLGSPAEQSKVSPP